MPIYHPDLVDESIKVRTYQDGLWGFTGNDSPPPSPSNIASSLGALSEWGITIEKMVKSPPPTPKEAALIERAGKEVNRYVRTRWAESEWETAWFVNPPVSCPSIAMGVESNPCNRDCKASQDWPIFMSSPDVNRPNVLSFVSADRGK